MSGQQLAAAAARLVGQALVAWLIVAAARDAIDTCLRGVRRDLVADARTEEARRLDVPEWMRSCP